MTAFCDCDCSIVIVSWNTRELLRACLASIPRAGRATVEVIVVDNGSHDGSPEMVAADFPWVRLVANEENRGFAAANNQGFALALGRYLLLLNSDTEVIDPGTIDACLACAEADPRIAVLGGRVSNPDGSVQPTCFRDPRLRDLVVVAAGLRRATRPPWLARLAGHQTMRDWTRDDARDVDVVTGCHMLVRAEAVADVGTFDEDFFFYGEEGDWCRRFRDAGWRVHFAPVGEVVHHGGASSIRIDGERGVLLARALVRLMRKHQGPVAGAAAWLILLGSHVSRAALFGLLGTCTLDRRRLHLARLAASTAGRFGTAWPLAR